MHRRILEVDTSPPWVKQKPKSYNLDSNQLFRNFKTQG